jgi:hypothetical protein
VAVANLQKDPFWFDAATLCLVVIAAYCFLPRGGVLAQKVEPPPQPGWHAVMACAAVQSFDRTSSLTLNKNGWAELIREDKNGKLTLVEGTWEYTATSNQYAITLDNKTERYALDIVGDGSCTLLKDTLGAVDLRASWFTVPTQPTDYLVLRSGRIS